MTSTRFPSFRDEPPARRALAAGLAASVCVGGAAALAAYLSGMGGPGLAAAAFSALLAGFAVERHCRLRALLKRREEESCAVRAELVRSNRALVALGAVNHELIHATDRDVFLAGVCRVLVEKAGYDLVWVGMAELGATSRVRVAAKAGEDAQWLDAMDIRYDDGVRGHGPAGTAIREGRIVSMPRFSQERFYAEWPDRPPALDRFQAGIAFPLRIDKRVVGALSIYGREEREFGEEEVALLTQMADDMAHGLHVLRLSASRAQALRLLRLAFRASSAMAATSRALVVGDLDMAGMATLVLGRAMEITASPLGAVGLVDPRLGRLDWITTLGPDGPVCNAPVESAGFFPEVSGIYTGPFAAALNAGAPVRQNVALSLDACAPPFPDGGTVRAFLAVPLRRMRGGPGGLLLLADAPAGYADRDVRLLQRLATLLDMGAARLGIERELIEARRRAEAANQAKTQFLANISHELRTPINGIMGMAQLAILEGATGSEAEYWRTVRESTDRLVEIVDNLLELASVESGSFSPMLRDFSLRRLLESLRSAYSVRASLAGLGLDLAVDASLPDKLMGDSFRLRQILAHLLDNAIRFTPSGTVSLRAGLLAPEEGGNRVLVARDFSGVRLVFTVLDTGVGIAKDRQAAIFESFSLGEDPLTKRFGGTGMGLSIARKLAELLGGSIWVESQEGYGSTFRLAVPLWPVAPPEREGDEPPQADLPPLKFLVVEDEAINRLALARGLRKLGHTVEEAGNGEEALRKLSLAPVDVVVMDIQMPVMDGLTAVAHIRNGEVPGASRRLPVVALTAYALDGDRQRFLAAGMDEFVTKPCDMGQLLRAVARVLPR
ncbi:hybrid sensor histidine kinase/response regulator [Solidesulfovibrio sp.]|uniref:hybrid sensor histidine kinase/response regulator n=1 Tax=Solidesulfovibrio sp. TaxID=2910990 RepID=UPI002B1F9E9A|nr:GAF domain-containing protein [Solidesulfovibrio sp.]MEA5087543.1 GAF domain-containing protein [Solidesulfovibrio sp.]